jgi:3-oxoacid coA-transferase, A subunit
MMSKIISLQDAVSMIPNGATIMFGGFLGCGSAHKLIEALAESGKGDFTIIGNDCGIANGPDGEMYGTVKLIHNRQVKRVIASHVGMTPEVGIQNMIDKTLEVDLVPQGSLAEMIRAGGAGLGGVLTPTGVGTIVEDSPLCLGKQTVCGKDYLLMKPLHADFALVNACKIDKAGNMWYKGTTRNFNVLAATAADIVIAEADNLVEVGEIAPENVVTPGAYVKYIVDGGEA